MQITSNTTGMEAGLTVAADKEGRDFCVVVVKGTFTVSGEGDEPELAAEQVPPVGADEFTGEPGLSAPLNECDFARCKPRCDVLMNGSAYAIDGRPTRRVTVSMRVGTWSKSFDVVGNRAWRSGVFSPIPGDPEPFTVMPISYGNAFGGVDRTHEDPAKHRWYPTNHVGAGYCENPKAKAVEGRPLPNTEESGREVKDPRGPYRPMAFGPVGRAWLPRIQAAGTYDAQWQSNKFPYLPDDFDERYFQAAPEDQWVPFLAGGERVQCTNTSPRGRFEFAVPEARVYIRCRFRDRYVDAEPNLDTLIVEPDNQRFLLIWRVAVPIGRKLHALREVSIDGEPRSRRARGKPHFRSLDDHIAWEKQRVSHRRAGPGKG